jgi:transposase
MKTRDARSLSAEAQEEIRLRAIQFVLNGRTQVEAAEVFGITRQAVGQWVKKKGRPKGGSLLPWQAAQVVRTIQGRCPDQLKLPFYLWTREAVGQLIKKRHGIQLSVWTVGRYLSYWGFTPQKPIRHAWERNPQDVQRWLEEEYPEIRKQAKAEKAQIFWGDEMGLRSDHTVGRSYGRKGLTPVIPGTGHRFGCNMISAITNRGRLYFMVFKKRFDADVLLTFLKRLVRQNKKKLYLIIDGHPVHRSSKVKKWLKENEKRINIFFLPSFSPELNPDELLNQDVKSNALGRQRPHTQYELIHSVRNYLWMRQQQPYVVKNYFREKHVLYASF